MRGRPPPAPRAAGPSGAPPPDPSPPRHREWAGPCRGPRPCARRGGGGAPACSSAPPPPTPSRRRGSGLCQHLHHFGSPKCRPKPTQTSGTSAGVAARPLALAPRPAGRSCRRAPCALAVGAGAPRVSVECFRRVTSGDECGAPRGEGGAKCTASGVPREAFQPGDPAFPPISAPPRAPRPLFSPSGKGAEIRPEEDPPPLRAGMNWGEGNGPPGGGGRGKPPPGVHHPTRRNLEVLLKALRLGALPAGAQDLVAVRPGCHPRPRPPSAPPPPAAPGAGPDAATRGASRRGPAEAPGAARRRADVPRSPGRGDRGSFPQKNGAGGLLPPGGGPGKGGGGGGAPPLHPAPSTPPHNPAPGPSLPSPAPSGP